MDPASLAAGIPWEFETFPEYLAAVERHGTVLNYAAYIGHTPLRIYVMGDEASAARPTADEIDADGGARPRGDRRRRVPGSPPASPSPTSAPTASRSPAGGRTATRSTRCASAVADDGRGVDRHQRRQRRPALRPSIYDLQRRARRPVHLHRPAHLADRRAPEGAGDAPCRAGAAGARCGRRCRAAPLTFSMTMVEPFTLNTSPVFAELMPRSLDERARRPTPTRRGAGACASGVGTRAGPRRRAGTPTRSWSPTAHPELVGRRLLDIADGARRRPFDALLDIALDEPDLQRAAGQGGARQRRRGRRRRCCCRRTGCTLGLSDAGAHVGQLCDAPLATDLLGTLGARARACSRSRRPCTS